MKLNKAGITGFVLCFTAILFGIATNGGMETIISYLHLSSLLVTVGGSFFAVMATTDSFEDLIFGLSGFIEAFRVKGRDIDHVCEEILYMSDIARREGILALEDRMQSMDNSFLKKGMTLVIDGADPELIKDIIYICTYTKLKSDGIYMIIATKNQEQKIDSVNVDPGKFIG